MLLVIYANLSELISSPFPWKYQKVLVSLMFLQEKEAK